MRKKNLGFLFIIPALILYIFFVIYPTANSIGLSFFKWDGLAQNMTFVGLKNYITMFTNDRVFLISLKNSIVWSCLIVIIPTFLGLIIASVIFSRVFAGNLHRLIILFPFLISNVAVGLIWKWMYNPGLGTVNTFLNKINLEIFMQDWLGDTKLVIFSLIIANIWQLTGLAMIIFYAGMQSIPGEIYEAAKIDGASSFRIFKNITIPLLKEIMIIVVVLMATASWRVFDIVWVVTRGGPANKSQVVGSWMFISAFRNYKHGYASAIAVFIFLIIIIPSFLYMRLLTRKETEF